MLTITIGNTKSLVQIRDGRNITVYSTQNQFKSRDISLKCCQGLKIENVSIIDDREGFKQELFFPNQLKAAILTFLSALTSEKDCDFDCFSFVCLMFGIKFHRHSEDLGTHWEEKEPFIKHITEPAIGEALFLTYSDDGMICLRHAGIYLGSGLYISVGGPGGDITFSTLEDMRVDWEGQFISIAQSRNQQKMI